MKGLGTIKKAYNTRLKKSLSIFLANDGRSFPLHEEELFNHFYNKTLPSIIAKKFDNLLEVDFDIFRNMMKVFVANKDLEQAQGGIADTIKSRYLDHIDYLTAIYFRNEATNIAENYIMHLADKRSVEAPSDVNLAILKNAIIHKEAIKQFYEQQSNGKIDRRFSILYGDASNVTDHIEGSPIADLSEAISRDFTRYASLNDMAAFLLEELLIQEDQTSYRDQKKAILRHLHDGFKLNAVTSNFAVRQCHWSEHERLVTYYYYNHADLDKWTVSHIPSKQLLNQLQKKIVTKDDGSLCFKSFTDEDCQLFVDAYREVQNKPATNDKTLTLTANQITGIPEKHFSSFEKLIERDLAYQKETMPQRQPKPTKIVTIQSHNGATVSYL